jgi:hypothetical protein
MLLQPVSTDRAMDAMSRELYCTLYRLGVVDIGTLVLVSERTATPRVLEAVVQP